jgi:succinoglycan biosynthesis transport protein ExoP
VYFSTTRLGLESRDPRLAVISCRTRLPRCTEEVQDEGVVGDHHRQELSKEGKVAEQLRVERPGLQVLLRLLRRRALLVAIPLVIVPAAALAFSLQEEKKYSASASLLFRDSGAGTTVLASTDPEREAATIVRVLQTGVVERRVARKLGGSIPGSVSVISEGDSNLVTVKATATTPRRAARVANTYTEEYIAYRRDSDRREIASERRSIRRELASIGRDRQRRFERGVLRRQLAELAVAGSQSGAPRQVGSAEPSSSPSSPKPLRNTLIGALVGLVIGLGLAVARDRLDRRIRDPEELQTAFDRPIIGRIPKSRALAKTTPGTSGLPRVEADAFHSLRANLVHFAGDHDTQSLVVTSAEPEEGKTTVAWNLACAASGASTKVMLIEGDLRRPTLAGSLGAGDSPGLSDLLAGKSSLGDVVRQVAVPASQDGNGTTRTLDVILAGSSPSNPMDLLNSKRMAELLRTAAASYDLVVIDTPPTSAAADAVPLFTQVGGVIVVGRIAKSTYDSTAELSDLLKRIDAPTLGVVVNSAEVRRYQYGPYSR